ncbi:hypothetical protein ACWCP6_28440 [Streptomyces sp. NPDC002004]
MTCAQRRSFGLASDRVRKHALGLLMVGSLVVLTACGGSDRSSSPHHSATPGGSASAAPSASPDPRAAAKGDVLRTYGLFWDEQIKAYAKGDIKGTDFRDYAAALALSSTESDLADLRSKGSSPVIDTFVAGAGTNVPAIDPAVVARQAVSKMKLSGPDIASPRTTGKYVLGVPMWMWVHKSPTTYGPNTTSATAGGVTVTATAKVTQIVWSMGDGSTVTCKGPGTPYAASYREQGSPTCGHTYARTSATRPGKKYPVSATATWSVDWQVNGGGPTGQFTEVRRSNMRVAIGELQVVG